MRMTGSRALPTALLILGTTVDLVVRAGSQARLRRSAAARDRAV